MQVFSSDSASPFTPAPPLLISLTEACRLLGISRPMIERWVADGRIVSVLFGRRRLIETKELNRLIRTLRESSPERTAHDETAS
jgi:excisionase family DNA binding protein